jgi:Tfp pilus assembly protein PilX
MSFGLKMHFQLKPQSLVHSAQPAKQAGVVLFIALIALIVMSLAAVALIRSVDTNTIIAGNLSFKQSALISSDSGVETALSWLGVDRNLDSNLSSNGYYASFSEDAKALADGSNAQPATGANITAGVDSSGNTIRYVIERMCKKTGAADTSHCLYGPPGEDENSKSHCDLSNPCLGEPTGALLYRITTRVTGPKNTVTYSQAFVY